MQDNREGHIQQNLQLLENHLGMIHRKFQNKKHYKYFLSLSKAGSGQLRPGQLWLS